MERLAKSMEKWKDGDLPCKGFEEPWCQKCRNPGKFLTFRLKGQFTNFQGPWRFVSTRGTQITRPRSPSSFDGVRQVPLTRDLDGRK